MQIDPKTRRLLLPHLYNTRDLGGTKTKDGKVTSYHRLIRSDALDQLTEDEISDLSGYPVQVILDLRSESEAKSHPDRIIGDPRFSYYNIPLIKANADDIADDFIQNVISTSLGHMYVNLFETSGEYLVQALRKILEVSPSPVLFHCAHGKDRTGILTAIFYMLCHVDRKDIVENYAVSYEYVRDLVAPLMAATEEHVHHIYRSDASNMIMLLDHLDEKYDGDIRIYLRRIGLSEKEILDLAHILLPEN